MISIHHIKKPVQAKFSGDESDIQELLRVLSRDFEVSTGSRFIPNQAGEGSHLFVTLISKNYGINYGRAEK